MNMSAGELQEIKNVFKQALTFTGCEDPLTSNEIIGLYPDLKLTQRKLSAVRKPINKEEEERGSGIYIGSNKKGYFLVKTQEDAESDDDDSTKTINSLLVERKRERTQKNKIIDPQGELRLE